MADDLLEAVSNLKIKEEPEPEFEETSTYKKTLTITKGHQCYFNWVDEIEFEKCTATADELIEIIQGRFDSKKEYEEIALKYKATEFIGDKGSLAYIFALQKNIVEAKAALAEARDFIQVCSKKSFVGEEYLSGFDYVFDCLEVYLDTFVELENISDKGLQLWKQLPKFEELGPKTQAAVLATKFYFFKELRKDKEEQLHLLTDVIRLDADCYEWHFCKASVARYLRRTERYHQDRCDIRIFAEEMRELKLAKALAPNHPLCKLDCSYLLAEIAKRTRPVRYDWKEPLQLGSPLIHNFDELAEFLKKECLEILGMYDKSVRVNTTIADIFSKWLPGKYRNYDLVESCLKRALEIHPKSSKGNHRLASFYLTRHPPDMAQAEKYCLLAIDCDRRNFPACAELVQILLGNPAENESRILDIMDSNLGESAILTDRNKADLYFYKGILLHLKSGFEIEATESWLTCTELGGNRSSFEWLKSCCARYNWPYEKLTTSKILDTIKYAKESPKFGSEKTVEIDNLMTSLARAEAAAEERLSQTQQLYRGGGDGAHRGQRGYRGSGSGGPYRGRGRGGGGDGYSEGTDGKYRGKVDFRDSSYNSRGNRGGFQRWGNSGSESDGPWR